MNKIATHRIKMFDPYGIDVKPFNIIAIDANNGMRGNFEHPKITTVRGLQQTI